MLRLPPSPARRAVPLLLLGALVACSAAAPPEEEADPGEAADALSIANLYRVATGTVDRSKVDPANPWAQTTLGVGEEYRLPDEDAEFAAIGKLVNRFQDHSKKESGAKKLERAFHAKSHACVLGSLAIDPAEMPAAARVGLFAEAATYSTWARFSNGVGERQSDRKLDLRGFALKIMGVKGPRIVTTPGDEAATTQDFLMGNHDVAPASDARHMMAFGEAMMGSADSSTILGKIDNLLQAGGFLTSNENVRIVDFLANHALDKTKKVGSLLGDTFSTGATNALGLEAGDPLKARAKGAFKLVVKTGVLQGTRCAPIDQPPRRPRTSSAPIWRSASRPAPCAPTCSCRSRPTPRPSPSRTCRCLGARSSRRWGASPSRSAISRAPRWRPIARAATGSRSVRGTRSRRTGPSGTSCARAASRCRRARGTATPT